MKQKYSLIILLFLLTSCSESKVQFSEKERNIMQYNWLNMLAEDEIKSKKATFARKGHAY